MFIPFWFALIFILSFILMALVLFFLGRKLGEMKINRLWEGKLPEIRKEAATRSKGVVRGQIMEQITPYFPDFPFQPHDCHFLGKPVDFIVFQGLSDEDARDSSSEPAIIFVEVKTGAARLSEKEARIRDVIKRNRVFWYEYYFPTKKI